MEIIILTIIIAAIFTALPHSGENAFPINGIIVNVSDYIFRQRPEMKKEFIPVINNYEFNNDLKEKIFIVNNNMLLSKSD